METQIREALARGYCYPENEMKILDATLIEAMVKELVKSFSPAKTAQEQIAALTVQLRNQHKTHEKEKSNIHAHYEGQEARIKELEEDIRELMKYATCEVTAQKEGV